MERSSGIDLIYESPTTRVALSRAGGGVSKEYLGPDGWDRSRRESETLQRLAGIPGVVGLLGVSSARAMIDLEHGGTSLAESIRLGPLPAASAVSIGEQLARSLAAIHRLHGVHGDISPSNILMAPDGRALLIDFDRAGHDHSQTRGTLRYAAPEQSGRTGRDVDHRADLYALGATLYELVTGQPPFDSDDPLDLMHSHMVREPAAPFKVNPQVPAALSEILLRLLAKDPEHRYQSGEGLAHDLRRLRETAAAATFALGERDFPARLSPPAQLVGRDAELAAILEAFESARFSTKRTVLIEGDAGVGKSALLERLRTNVIDAGGWFLQVKFDQFHEEDAVAEGVTQALRGVGRHLLTLAPAERESERIRHLDHLGPNAGVIAFIPEFRAFLGVAETMSFDSQRAAPRLVRAAVDVLRAAASPRRPVVLALEDLQWSDAMSLSLFDAVMAQPGIEGLMLVGTQRPVAEGHVLADAIRRWAEHAPTRVALRNLPTPAVTQLLSHMLRHQGELVSELARAVEDVTAGNPLEAVDLVNALRGDGVLRLAAGGWQCDLRAVRRYAGSGLSQRLAARITELAARSRLVLETMSCLGSPIDVGVLAIAAGLPPDTTLELLRALADDALVVIDAGVGGPVRFGHDLIQQGVHALLAEEHRASLRLEIARKLAAEGLHREAAEQYLPCTAQIVDPEERRAVAGMFLRVAQALMPRGQSALAENYLARAEELAGDGHDGLCESILAERHGALVALRRFDESDALYEFLGARIKDPVRLVGPTIAQDNTLRLRARNDEARILSRGLLRQLGIADPTDDNLFRPIDALDRVAAQVRRDAEEGRLNATAASDPRDLAVANLLPCLAFGFLDAGEPTPIAVQVECYRFWAEKGLTPKLGNSLVSLAVSLGTVRQDYRTGAELGRQVVAAAEASGLDELAVLALHQHMLSFVAPWSLPLEDCLDRQLAVRARLEARGETPDSMVSGLPIADLMLQCESLAACEAEIDAAIDFAERTAFEFGVVEGRFVRRLARAMRGRAEDSGEQSDAATFAASLPTLAVINIQHARMRMAFYSVDYDEMLRIDVPDLPLVPFEEGQPIPLETQIALPPETYLVMAVRCIEQLRREPGMDREARLLTLERFRAWYAARALEVPANFKHLAHYVEAEQAWLLGDSWKAAAAFDAALREARRRRRPWHQAFIAERTALFHLAHGMEETGKPLMAIAREGYANWGVQVKVRAMEAAHPWLRGFSNGPMQALRTTPSGTPSSDALDLMGILRASHALSSQRSIRDLASRVTDILAALTGATKVTLALKADREWRAEGRPLPISVLRYVESTAQPLQVDDVARDERFARDPYFGDGKPHSLMVVPVASQGETVAMLVLENDVARAAFGTQRLDTVMLIAGQLAVSIGNARLYDELEGRVRSRTAELEAVQEQLVATARRAGMAQVASNVLHNVGNVLTSVNVVAATLRKKLRDSPTQGLSRAVQMMKAHDADLGRFLTADEQGRLLPTYLEQLDLAIRDERGGAVSELDTLLRSVDYIGSIIGSQQAYAGAGSFAEPVSVDKLLDEAVRVNIVGAGHDLEIERRYGAMPTLQLDKVRLMQILVNLVANSIDAMNGAMNGSMTAHTLTLESELLRTDAGENLRIVVRDTGQGIARENLERLFTHGFTTKKDGHGFGLHGAAIAAMEMGGTLTPDSEGEGRGAAFTLHIPVRRAAGAA